MATCRNCGKENVKVLIRADDSFKEQRLGWCAPCLKQAHREMKAAAVGQLKEIYDNFFGEK